MPEQGKQFVLGDAEQAARAVVLQLLRDDHAERWSRSELERELADISLLAVDRAVVSLAENEVVRVCGNTLSASRCCRHLDALGLISV
jgi:hypothetical protein